MINSFFTVVVLIIVYVLFLVKILLFLLSNKNKKTPSIAVRSFFVFICYLNNKKLKLTPNIKVVNKQNFLEIIKTMPILKLV